MEFNDYKGKTFGEVLSDIRSREGEQVKIGSSDSGAFYWVGDCTALTDIKVDLIDADLRA